MAGIGFELKKLFNKRSLILNLRAYIYSSFVSIGPFILCTLMISSMNFIISSMVTRGRLSVYEKEVYIAAVVYAFVFSQIVTSGFSMVITRYISDKLYSKEYGKILPSLYGILTLVLSIAGIIGIVFYYRSPLEAATKFLGYILYMELTMLWLLTVYLSALKDYAKIANSFLYGIAAAVLTAYSGLKFTSQDPIQVLLFALSLGVCIIISALMFYIQSFFKEVEGDYFAFLIYLKKYKTLFFTCLCYTLAIYVHNFIFWGSNLGINIEATYLYAPLYDVPTFYAFLTIIPTSVIFVVSVETAFYDKYKAYFSLIILGGNLRDIERAKTSMITVMWQEVRHLMEVQLFYTVILLIIGILLLPVLGLSHVSVDIFALLTLGAFLNSGVFVLMLLLLYFEARESALVTTAVFVTTNALFSLISLRFGENYYGMGFLISALTAFAAGFLLLSRYLKELDYNVFCRQPLLAEEAYRHGSMGE